MGYHTQFLPVGFFTWIYPSLTSKYDASQLTYIKSSPAAWLGLAIILLNKLMMQFSR